MNMKLISVFLVIVSAGFLFQCDLASNGTAMVRIDLGGAQGKALAPSAVVQYSLSITGDGMDPIARTFSADTASVSLRVPAGPARKFVLEAIRDPLDLNFSGAVYSFIGTKVADLAPNRNAYISLPMIPGETKLFVPDTYNNRIVQLESFSDTVTPWAKMDLNLVSLLLTGWPTSPLTAFSPSAVDMDAKGRLYIGNYNILGTSAYNRIVRSDNITGTGIIQYPSTSGFDGQVQSLAVDKLNNIIYFYYTDAKAPYSIRFADLSAPPAPSSDYPQINLQGEIPSTFLYAFGMDVDENGLLYMTCVLNPATPVYYILKIDPSRPQGSRVLKAYTDPSLVFPFDIVVKGYYLYVTNNGGADGYKLLKFNRADLSLVAHAGVNDPVSGPTFTPGEFFGPERFINKWGKKLIVSDEGTYGPPTALLFVNRIIQFDDENFGNWTARTGLGDPFKLFDNN
jgi:hypothetical protein